MNETTKPNVLVMILRKKRTQKTTISNEKSFQMQQALKNNFIPLDVKIRFK